MSKYKGLFTFDVENHRYVTVGAADGIIDCMDYAPSEPLIIDNATAMLVRAWAKHWGIERVKARTSIRHGVELVGWVDDSRGREIDIKAAFVSGEIEDGHEYAIEELCGEEEG